MAIETGIRSNEKTLHHVFLWIGIAISIFAIPLLFSTILRGSSNAIFPALLFVAPGLGFIVYAAVLRRRYLRLGATVLYIKPDIVLGKTSNATFFLEKLPKIKNVSFEVRCEHIYTTSSNDSNRTHVEIIFKEKYKAQINQSSDGKIDIGFDFRIPEDQPETGCPRYRGNIKWWIKCFGYISTNKMVPGTDIVGMVDFERNWEIHVEEQPKV